MSILSLNFTSRCHIVSTILSISPLICIDVYDANVSNVYYRVKKHVNVIWWYVIIVDIIDIIVEIIVEIIDIIVEIAINLGAHVGGGRWQKS